MIQYILLLVVFAIAACFILFPYFGIVAPSFIGLFWISIALGLLVSGIVILVMVHRGA